MLSGYLGPTVVPMATLRSFGRLVTPQFKLCRLPMNLSNSNIRAALISTSKKTKDTHSLMEPILGRSRPADPDPDAKDKIPENWISWGFCEESIIEDNTRMHIIFFCTVTMCLVGGGFILMYMPDNRNLDWHQREAFLELRRREMEGLPLIDKDLIPEAKVLLPSDEELGDIEIVI